MKRNSYLMAAAFLFGIIIANLWGKELLTTYGIFNTYFLNQYAYAKIDYDRLLYQILWIRGKEVAAVLILGKIFQAKAVLLLLECLLAVTFGILMVVAIANFGAKGVILALGGVLPQWLFYLAGGAMFFAIRIKEEPYLGKSSPGIFAGYAISLLIFIFGILLEVYVGPVLWQQILKKI